MRHQASNAKSLLSIASLLVLQTWSTDQIKDSLFQCLQCIFCETNFRHGTEWYILCRSACTFWSRSAQSGERFTAISKLSDAICSWCCRGSGMRSRSAGEPELGPRARCVRQGRAGACCILHARVAARCMHQARVGARCMREAMAGTSWVRQARARACCIRQAKVVHSASVMLVRDGAFIPNSRPAWRGARV